MRAIEVKRGDRFGRLVVIRELARIDRTIRVFECKCDCGMKKPMRLYNLRSGNSYSCGCQQTPSGSANPKFRHGVSQHRLYHSWHDMIRRCYDKEHKQYPGYGGRGIIVCDEWRDDVYAFVRWGIAKGWQRGLLLDREDNDGNYDPENCRFVTPEVSSNNRRSHGITPA